MRRGRSACALAALAVLLSGCAVPRWVPWIGRRDTPRPAGPAAATLPPAPEPPAEDRSVERPSPRPGADDQVTDRVIAVVNNDAITLGELQESVAVFRYENRSERIDMTEEEIVQQFLNRLIDNRLQLQEAEREKVVVDDSEVEEELADRMKKLKFSSQQEFEAMLKSQGITLDALKKRLSQSLKVQKVVRRKVALRVSVTDAEIDQYLETNREKLETGLSYHARHILVQPESNTDAAWDAARARADAIERQLAGGADFAELARQYSRDASARDGGDLGTLKRGELAQDIEAQILRLQPGQISPPYRSALGFHIFRLESKETLEGEGLARIRQQIREILFRQKYEARHETWLRELKQRAIIEVRL